MGGDDMWMGFQVKDRKKQQRAIGLGAGQKIPMRVHPVADQLKYFPDTMSPKG
jgi:hypothetical protein